MRCWCALGTEFRFGEMRQRWRRTVMVVTQQGEGTSRYQTVRFKMVDFIAHTFYHNETKTNLLSIT